MGLLLDKFDQWAEDEVEDSMNLLWKLYGPLTQISCCYPSFKRSMLPVTVLTTGVHTIMLGSHFVLLLVTVQRTVVDWNLELVSLAVHFALLIFMGMFSLFYTQYIRNAFSSQARIMSKDVGRYRSGRIYEEEWCVKALEENWKETLRFLGIPLLIGLGSGIVLILPYAMKSIKGMENPYGPGIVNENLPFPCWYPFPTHEGVLHWTAVICQFVAAFSLGIIIVQDVLFFLMNSQRVKYELRVVGYSLKTLFSRSMKLYLQMNPGKNQAAVHVRDPEYQRVLELCLIDSVIHHHAIGELVSLLIATVDVLGMLAYTIGTGVIGMSLFNILVALNTNNYGSLILFGIMILCETLVMFLLSFIGEAITDQTVDLRNQLYSIKWYNLDLRNRKILLNFHTAMTEPTVISCMGLINLSLDTFSSIMNSAYSFFNLMNTQTGA